MIGYRDDWFWFVGVFGAVGCVIMMVGVGVLVLVVAAVVAVGTVVGIVAGTEVVGVVAVVVLSGYLGKSWYWYQKWKWMMEDEGSSWVVVWEGLPCCLFVLWHCNLWK